jgi:hypothetical protein
MPLASFVKRNLGCFSHIYAKKHLVVEISVQSSECGKLARVIGRRAVESGRLGVE